MQAHPGLCSLYCIVRGMFGGSAAIYAQYMQVAAGLHSIYCIVHGMFGGNAVIAQQYMRVSEGLAQPLVNHAWKNMDCGLGDMATDHMMLCRRDPLQKVLLQGVPLQQKYLTLQYKRRASPSQIPFPDTDLGESVLIYQLVGLVSG